jgi:hypothetical protein
MDSVDDIPDDRNHLRQPGIVHLPTELLLQIFEDIDTNDLYSLSLISRRLHYLALPIYLSRQGIPNSAQDYLEISGHRFRAIPALRAALYITKIKKLSCRFNDPECKVLDYRALTTPLEDISNLERLALKLSHVEDLTLDFGKFGFWYIVDDYATRFCRLLAASVNLCDSLTVKRDMRFRQSFGLDFSLRWAAWRRQPVTWPDRVRYQPLTVFKNTLGSLRERAFPSPAIIVEPEPAVPKIKAFAIHTTMLFEHPLLREWTVNTLNASRLVSLCIQITIADDPIMNEVLPSLTIPSLCELSIHSRVPFDVLVDFLNRHGNITTLTIGREVPHPTSRRLPRSSLSHLTTLHATPEYIVHLLRPNALRRLRYLSIISRVPFGPCWDVDGIDYYLFPISRRVQDTTLSLKISIVSNTIAPEYMDKLHLWPSPDSRKSCTLHHVSSLVLELEAPLPLAAGGDALYYFQGWLNQFPPRLEHITFVGSWFACTERGARDNLVWSIREAYPRIQSVTLDGERFSFPGNV